MQTELATGTWRAKLSSSWKLMLRLLGVAFVGSVSLFAILSLTNRPIAGADIGVKSLTLSGSLNPAAYLYHLEGGIFFTISLPAGSRPADVSVVSDTLADRIWFSEPGLGRIGQVVYTSSVDYALIEYNVGGNPTNLVASTTDVWFTLPPQNQVGYLDVASGAVELINIPSAQAGLADIAVDTYGRAWVTEHTANRLALLTISPTVAITEYVLPTSGLMPQGIALDSSGNVWFTTDSTGYLWLFTPASNEYLALPPLGSNTYPHRIALDNSNHIWATLQGTSQIARVTLGTLPLSETYPIPTLNSQPGAIGIDALGQVYFAEEAAAQIGKLGVTSTSSFTEYPLPRLDLKLTGLAVADDGSVWAAAYHDVYQILLPTVMRNYNSTPPPFAIQMYGSITATTGFTWLVSSGAGWVRFPIDWSSIEPVNTTPANFNWGATDASIQTASNSNVKIIATITTNPAWAAKSPNGPVTNTADLQQFIGALVAHYPQIQYWEFYNEPDSTWYNLTFGFNTAGYAAMLKAIYPVVKSANPDAKVVMGGLALDWFTVDGGPFYKNFLPEVLSDCLGHACFDFANFHYYPFFRSVWEPYGHDIIGKATYVRQVLAAYGYNQPILNTEVGWPNLSTYGGPEISARYAPKAFARSLAAGLPLANWYSLTDADSSDPGLLDASLNPRLAFTATQTFMRILGQAQYARAIPSSETGSSQIEGYQFTAVGTNGSRRVDIYWYDCPSMYDITLFVNGLPVDCNSIAPLTITGSRIGMIDKLGNETILSSSNGRVTLPRGVVSSPIYIDYQP